MFAIAGNAGADGEVGATIDQELDDLGVRPVKVGQSVEDRGLATYTVSVDVGEGINVCPPVEKEPAGVEEAILGGDVKEGCAAEADVATGRAAIQLWVAAVEQFRVGIEQSAELAGAAAEEREDARNVVARVSSCSQEELDAGAETLGVARISLDDIVESRAGIPRVAAVGVGTVIEKPLERLRFEILARCEESGEPAPAESVDIGSVTDQKLHHRNAAGLRDTLEGHFID
jgi:hypothetical protein